MLSRLNLKLQAGAYGKTIVVHVDRVQHMNLHDEGVIFDANRNALSFDTPNPVPPSGTFKANERDSTVDICVSVDPDLQDNVSVRYHSPDETFSAYPESDTVVSSHSPGCSTPRCSARTPQIALRNHEDIPHGPAALLLARHALRYQIIH